MHSLGNVSETLKEQLVTDYSTADITDFEKQMLGYARMITIELNKIDSDYIAGLKSAGFTEENLHDIVQVASYFNYVNRLADALGVELEEEA